MLKNYMTARLGHLHFRAPDDTGAGGGDTGSGGGGADKDKGRQDPGSGGSKKVDLTQDELDAIITDRVARAVSKANKDAKDKADKEKMDETDRLKKEKEEAETAKKEADARAQAAEWRADLVAHVVDPIKAIKLIDPDKHVKSDGSVNVEAFLKDNPFMAKKAESRDDDDDDGTSNGRRDDSQGDKRGTGPDAGGTQKGKKSEAEESWGKADAEDRKRRK